jgi:hypothetical protein
MSNMRRKLAGIASVLTLVGIAACAYDNPSQPTPGPVDPRVPAQVTVGAAQGLGTQAGTATVTANVQNANGAPLTDVVVTFTTTRGTISPAQVPTSASGIASATLTANDTADVTASVGQLLSAHTLVVPTSGPAPVPAPTLPVSFLNVSGNGTTGVPLVFSVSSSAVGATWTWSFGDGAIEQSTAFSISHTYGRAGVYTATVSAAAALASSATITVSNPTAVPTPGAFVASMGCTAFLAAAANKLELDCNVAVTANGVLLPSNSITKVTWDWGDGKTDVTLTPAPVNTHNYASPGTYTVFASVTGSAPDGSSQTATTSQSVTVPKPPG